MEKIIKNKYDSKEKQKKSVGYILSLYIIISIIISAVFVMLEFAIGIIADNINIDLFTENAIFSIISTIVRVFIYIYVFIKILGKKYIVDESKEAFLHSFFILIIIIFSLSLIGNTINGKRRLYIRVTALQLVNNSLELYINDDKEKFKELAKGTEWENCNTYSEVREVSFKETENAIYYEIIKSIIIITTEIISNVILMEFFMRKQEKIFI